MTGKSPPTKISLDKTLSSYAQHKHSTYLELLSHQIELQSRDSRQSEKEKKHDGKTKVNGETKADQEIKLDLATIHEKIKFNLASIPAITIKLDFAPVIYERSPTEFLLSTSKNSFWATAESLAARFPSMVEPETKDEREIRRLKLSIAEIKEDIANEAIVPELLITHSVPKVLTRIVHDYVDPNPSLTLQGLEAALASAQAKKKSTADLLEYKTDCMADLRKLSPRP